MILIWLERFQGVKFKSEKRRFKNKKEEYEKVKTLYFHWAQKPKSFAISTIKTFFKNLFWINSYD